MNFFSYLIARRVKALWLRMPVRIEQKIRVKNFLFSKAGFIFIKFEAYKNWKRLNGLRTTAVGGPNVVIRREAEIDNFPTYIPFKKGSEKDRLSTNIIAFYLPQFHAIPENDEWWGEGFTEWSNVRPAKPLYAGHYQPHIPDDIIGYYNLLDADVQKRQIELAKNYGVSGFCYYFYWFSGRRLLESPLINFLKDESLDFPFCLCWANENWSRRWDGLENELLITQDYSEADDLAFIEYVSRYIKDPRYIRIDGKPLLVVYRPSLFPNVRKTVKVWRKWCLENGVGEILLGYTQSFEIINPQKYGFDLAIEFPPNSTNPPDLTEEVLPYNSDFQGLVYDWSIYLERSKSYESRSYPLVRGVCPSWDNTARKKNRSISFINSSPCGFQQWLCSALIDTQKASGRNKVDAVFVNAWNEWAEGAHLEPDKKYGFAWLEAVRLARTRASLILQSGRHDKIEKIAIILHVYCLEFVDEFVKTLPSIKCVDFKAFVSVRSDSDKFEVVELLSRHGIDFEIYIHDDQGVDILPFLKMAPFAIGQGYSVIAKVYGNKNMRDTMALDGDKFSSDKLFMNENLSRIISLLEVHTNLGIVGPKGYVFPFEICSHSNAKQIRYLVARLGVQETSIRYLNSVSGNAFVARSTALMPLLELDLNDEDFKMEGGQIDESLADAVKKCISVSAFSVNMNVDSCD